MLKVPQVYALMEFLESTISSLKADIKNLISLLSALVEDRRLPNRRLKLKLLSENQFRKLRSVLLEELFEHSDDDYTDFLTDEALFI